MAIALSFWWLLLSWTSTVADADHILTPIGNNYKAKRKHPDGPTPSQHWRQREGRIQLVCSSTFCAPLKVQRIAFDDRIHLHCVPSFFMKMDPESVGSTTDRLDVPLGAWWARRNTEPSGQEVEWKRTRNYVTKEESNPRGCQNRSIITSLPPTVTSDHSPLSSSNNIHRRYTVEALCYTCFARTIIHHTMRMKGQGPCPVTTQPRIQLLYLIRAMGS